MPPRLAATNLLFFLVTALLLSPIGPAVALMITAPQKYAGAHLNTPRVLPKHYPFIPVAGRVVESAIPANCSNVLGAIVILTTPTSPQRLYQDFTVELQNCGAVAAILRDTVSEYAGSVNAFPNENTARVRISMLSIGRLDAAALEIMMAEAALNNTYVMTDLSGSENDINYWELWANNYVGYLLQAIGVAVFSINSVVALGKLIAFARNDIFSLLVVPQAILSIRFVINLFRVIVWSADPMFLGRYFSYSISQFVFSITIPFEIIATLIQAFYWHKILSAKQAITSQWIPKLKIPIIIVVLLLIIVEAIATTLRAIGSFVKIGSVVSGLMYFIITLVTAIYFFVTGLRIVRKLRAGLGADSDGDARLLRRVVVSVVFTAVFNMLWAVALIIPATPIFLSNPFVFRGNLFTQSILQGLVSLVTILSIRAPFQPRHSPKPVQAKMSTTIDPGLYNKTGPPAASEHYSRHVHFKSRTATATATAADSVATTVIYDLENSQNSL